MGRTNGARHDTPQFRSAGHGKELNGKMEDVAKEMSYETSEQGPYDKLVRDGLVKAQGDTWRKAPP